MDKQSFFSILDKYQNGTASAAEKALVEEYYRRMEKAGKTELTADEEAVIRRTMYNQIAASFQDPEAKVIPIKRNYSKMAAAAVVLTMIGAGSYFFLFKKPATEPAHAETAKTKPRDLPPGHDAAVLTLSDGRTIILDSTRGTISQQGGATVINLNGQVSYANTAKDKPAAVVYNTISTARGNQYQLILADGSKVWLNSASSLRFPTAFTAEIREVELDGEGYFEVAKNANKPFHVKTKTQDIEVLGTHFNVNAYDDETAVKTTLLEGSVKVNQLATDNKQLAINAERSVVLKPGEQAELSRVASPLTTHHSPFTIDHSPDIDQVMAWKNGWFEFDKTDIKTIMRQISRWYDVDIRYEVKPDSQTYGGRISRNINLSNILKMLEMYGVHCKLEGKTLTVIR
ncbi:FecR domain-containing protein [Niastella sp. OAS944]|uniref:FecR domain-containing protein n=1 Tax=Niastella sp. OAS944 TaxID=2664089 RepID=UPI003475D4AD|nr:ferric-dicitrate binding protein FerR (iron transport regulator) [Chitinophagaceae bacterium OAS944]